MEPAKRKHETSSSTLLSNISLNESAILENDSQSISNRIGDLNLNDSKSYIKALCSLILDQLNAQDANAILETQKQIIQKLDQKNRNLQRSNQTSAETYNTYALKDFQLYTNSLNTMKQDLEFIFQRIRLLKNRFQTKYPSEYRKAIADNSQILVDDDDVEEEFNLKQTNEDRIQEVGTIEKERKKSIETATSAASNASAALVNLIQSARDRISSTGKEIVSGFITNSNNNNVVASPNDNKEESEDQKVIKEQEEDSHK